MPTGIAELPQWVGYKLKPKIKNGQPVLKANGKPKMDKIPMNPLTGGQAQTNNPATWADFETAVAGLNRYRFNGLGFVFTPEAGVTGIDLDDCVLADGSLNEFAQSIASQLNSYTEYSPSGDGVHILVRGSLPQAFKNGKIEMYSDGRFFTYTGKRVPGFDVAIRERQAELDQLLAQFAGNKETEDEPATTPVTAVNLDDQRLIDRARQAANGEKFNALWQGDVSGYDSQSEADYALCHLLAFWTGKDATAIDRLFRQSGLYREKWDERHFSSGATYGEQTISRAIANTIEVYEPRHTAVHSSANGQGPDTAVNLVAENMTISPLAYRPEDGGILDAWADCYGENWIFATGFGQWFRWAMTHWQDDLGYGLRAEIQSLLDEMNRRVRELRKGELDLEQRKMLGAYVLATKRSNVRVSSIEGMARNLRFVGADSLNSARLLNLTNGTLDLETLQLRPFNRDDRLTYCLPYAYDLTAKAPNWQRTIDRLDPETARFLQEFAGYALTPDTQHELALWLYGPPGSGKSTYLGGLQTMLGPKAGLLGLVDIERSRFALADLPGKTLVVSTEQPGDFIRSTHLLNAIISGEPILVERKFRDAIKVTPRAKIAWAMNDLPRVGDANNGVFRRVKVVSFPVLSEGEHDPDLKDAIAREGAGILNWALAGLERLQARGRFVIPSAVANATQEFISHNDIPAAFVADCCIVGPDYKVGGEQFYNAYKQWALDTGHKPLSSTSIAKEWRRLRFEKYLANGRAFWRGVGLSDGM